jgi:adenylosuccinate lyase
MLREQAYKVIQGHAMRAWESDGDFRAAVTEDQEILSHLALQKLDQAFSLERYLANVDYIFDRVFSSKI